MEQEYIEFIGFFWGEGCLSINKAWNRSKNDKRPCYQPIIQISLRDDDKDMVEWCHQKFGGHTYSFLPRKNTNSYLINPVCVWRLSGRENCQKVINVLSKGILPVKKKKELKVFQEFLDSKARGTRYGFQGRWYTDDELNKQGLLKEKLSSLKKYV